MPGGGETRYFNQDYQHAPSDYGAFQPDDDRAESVAAYLYDPSRLTDTRREILDQVFDLSVSASAPIIENVSPIMPKVAKIKYGLRESPEFTLRFGKVTTGLPGFPLIPLDQYRAMHTH